MPHIAIRCHPRPAVVTDELEEWLTAEIDQLRDGAPDAALRLLRLTKTGTAGEVEVGWLIEVDAAGRKAPLSDEVLGQVLRDMRLLGLQPTVLRPAEGASASYQPAIGGSVA